jgi:hypothetical protein
VIISAALNSKQIVFTVSLSPWSMASLATAMACNHSIARRDQLWGSLREAVPLGEIGFLPSTAALHRLDRTNPCADLSQQLLRPSQAGADLRLELALVGDGCVEIAGVQQGPDLVHG